jgi:hypothetical protein
MPVSDQWRYTHAAGVYGPVSGDELRRLVQTGGLGPEDMIWPEGGNPLEAVPALAALRFPRRTPVDPVDEAPDLPEWLPELAAALASGEDLAALPCPPPAAWLPDVRRTEGPAPPTRE